MTKQEYNEFYKTHGPSVHSDPIRFAKIAELCKGEILDIGCGTGDLADYYNGSYTGLDISDVAIEQAKKLRKQDAIFLVGDPVAENIPLYKQFDTIVMAEFIEHLDITIALWANIQKWSKPNTRIIITVPNGNRVPDKDHKKEFTIPYLREQLKDKGKIKFYNYAGAKERIIMTVDIGEQNENLLSLAMIVKNEEKGLEQAILSAIELVDNVTISVDKNSTDKTLEIARMYADTLKEHEWKDDFSAARNFCQEGIQQKWILALDGHEFLKESKNLERQLKSDFDSFFIKVRMENEFIFWSPRLFKSDIKLSKPVHNYPEIKNPAKINNFTIQHDRSGSQTKEGAKTRDEQRERMITKIFKKNLKKDKKDIRAMFYLAQHYQYTEKIKQAIRYQKRYLKYSTYKEERWLMFYELGNSYNLLNKPSKAIKYYLKANKEMPNRWEVAKKVGGTYMMTGKHEKALIYLTDSLGGAKGEAMYNPLQRNDAQTWYFISQCFFALKNYKENKIAVEQALEENKKSGMKDLPEHEVKILETILNA